MALARNIVHAEIDIASDTAHEVVANADATKRVLIVSFYLALNAAQTWSILSATTALGGDILALLSLQLDPVIDNGEVYPHFICAAGEAFNITSGAAATMDGWVKYILEDV